MNNSMDFFLIIIASILVILGIIGCIIPALPGPPLSYVGIILLNITRWGDLSNKLMIWLGVVVVIVTILDYILPAWFTKKFGGTKMGIWGSVIGLIIGLFFAPLGIIIGPFLGAFFCEMINNNNSKKALQSAIGSFVGFLFGTVAKIIVTGIIIYYFVVELFRGIIA
jgi:uncharacterized protein YqgC (DUF456 family)